MNTQNLHHFPFNLALLLVFGVLTFLPFSALFLFKMENTANVLGTSSYVTENVTLTLIKNITLVNFKYAISPFEIKKVKTGGTQIFLKEKYAGIKTKIVEGVLEITNESSKSYLLEGAVY
jgi:hypothetical protein